MQATNTPKKHVKAQPTRERIIDAARKLFDSKGFHAATTAELAAEAGVNIGLIYRHFESKDDIVLTIGERMVGEHIARRNTIFDGMQRGELSVFDAIKAFAYERLTDSEGIRHLAVLARPDALPKKLDTYADLMIACFTGLGYRPAIGIAENAEETSYEIACLLMTVGLPEPQPSVSSRSVPRFSPKRKGA